MNLDKLVIQRLRRLWPPYLRRAVLVTVAAGLTTGHASTELLLPFLFADGMVLQRNAPVPVWGWAPPDAKVTVRFAGQEHATTAATDGKWTLELDSLEASSVGHKFSVQAGSQSITLENVLVGEVWLCSGQSNMAWRMTSCTKGFRDPAMQPIGETVAHDIANDKDPLLRHVLVRPLKPRPSKNSPKGQWLSSGPATTPEFSAVAYYFGRNLRRELNVPIGLIASASGGTKIQPWMPPEAFQKSDQLKTYYEYYEAQSKWASYNLDPARAKALKEKAKSIGDADERRNMQRRAQLAISPRSSPYLAATQYDNKIRPLVPYAIKGVIWYQGESNRIYPNHYAVFFKAMIESWREAWGQGDFPFYYAQLANYMNPSEEPLETDAWATVSNQQRLTLTVPNTGMAIINDTGEAANIHPPNKIDVGKRLALLALTRDYDQKNLVDSGPLYKSSTFANGEVKIAFESVGAGLMVGEKIPGQPVKQVQMPLGGFQICEADRVWKWAEAKIASKDSVIVSHPEIKTPTEVRYAWSSNPAKANLYNRSGLPASLFKATRE